MTDKNINTPTDDDEVTPSTDKPSSIADALANGESISIRDSEINRINNAMIDDIIEHTRLTEDNVDVRVNSDGDITGIAFHDIDETESKIILPSMMKPYVDKIKKLNGWDTDTFGCVDDSGNYQSLEDDNKEDEELNRVTQLIEKRIDVMADDLAVLIRAISILIAEDRISADDVRNALYDSDQINMMTLLRLLSRDGIAASLHMAMCQMEAEQYIHTAMKKHTDALGTLMRDMIRSSFKDCDIEFDDTEDNAETEPTLDFEDNPEHSDESPMALESAQELINNGMMNYDDIAIISEQTKVPERVVKLMIDRARKNAHKKH